MTNPKHMKDLKFILMAPQEIKYTTPKTHNVW